MRQTVSLRISHIIFNWLRHVYRPRNEWAPILYYDNVVAVHVQGGLHMDIMLEHD